MNVLRGTLLGLAILLAAFVDSSTTQPNPETYQPNPEMFSAEISQPLIIFEDDEGWDCRVMGNHICGSVRSDGGRVLTLWLSRFVSVTAE